jgi:hypothetical protein
MNEVHIQPDLCDYIFEMMPFYFCFLMIDGLQRRSGRVRIEPTAPQRPPKSRRLRSRPIQHGKPVHPTTARGTSRTPKQSYR